MRGGASFADVASPAVWQVETDKERGEVTKKQECDKRVGCLF